MKRNDLKKYCQQAIEIGATKSKPVHPRSVVTAAWVRLKCQFGCPRHNTSYCCPPYTPTPQQTQEVLDCYQRAILFYRETPAIPDWEKQFHQYLKGLTDLEGAMFKDGYYKAFIFLAGPCPLCQECSALKGKPCKISYKARPCMEGCGIDVFQTARNNGLDLTTLKERKETKNIFCLMLVD